MPMAKYSKVRLILKAYNTSILNQNCDRLINHIWYYVLINRDIGREPTYLNYKLWLKVNGHKINEYGKENYEELLPKTKIVGPVALPTRRRIYCVLRSPHVNKDSREHLEIRVHKRLIDIYFPTEKLINALKTLDVSSGVGVTVRAYER
jgi:small subunit ribosomal protein S10